MSYGCEMAKAIFILKPREGKQSDIKSTLAVDQKEQSVQSGTFSDRSTAPRSACVWKACLGRSS